MEIIKPHKSGFTVYSKSGCINCKTAKIKIQENFFICTEINCDEYILENKEEFLQIMEELIGKPYRTFPMVFYNGEFIGGLNETTNYMNKLKSFDNIFEL